MRGEIPDKENRHRPKLIDNNRKTVAMYLAEKGIIPPLEWIHNPEMRDN